MADAAARPMVEVWRGDIPESHHRGHAVVCDASGAIRAAWGDPEAVILPRSSCKMLQALPLVESGAADGLSAPSSSRSPAPRTRARRCTSSRVARWLADLGLGEPDLRCGPQVPDDAPERHRLRAAGEAPCQLHNNCSGKHAGFLTLNRRLGGGPEYVEIDHPVQRAVRAAFEEMCGADEPRLGHRRLLGAELRHHGARPRPGDGAHGRPARARAARARRRRGGWWRRWSRIPLLVAGEGRACSELMAAMDGVAVKTGAEAVFVAILPARGLGVALKIEDGATRASEMRHHRAPRPPRRHRRRPSGGGAAAQPADPQPPRLPRGSVRPDPAFWAGGAAL